jgi:PKD domain/Lamin Tail Domain
MRYFVVGLALLLPAFSEAAVLISEVAWMGGTASANHEWIELYNDAGAVDVTGWSITDGMNLSISLTGTIPSQTYVVLERTSDAAAAGTAFLIYTGALVNTGATLQLVRADGGLEDQVAGGENWQSIGGDNLTKETAQHTTAGWVTAAPTPSSTNKGEVKMLDDQEEEKDDDDTDTKIETSNVKPKTSTGDTVPLILPGVSLNLKTAAQKVGYVNQPIEFSVTASGVGDTIIDSLTYQWNFGDGTTAFLKESVHSFQYPGTYIVTTHARYKRQEQLARHEITILPVSISLTTAADGSVQVNNDSPYEIDISGYTLAAEKEFVFPEYSVLLPNQTVTISRAKLGGGSATIKDKAGVIVLATKKSIKEDRPTVPTVSVAEAPLRLSAPGEEGESAWHVPLLAPLNTETTLLGAIKQYLSPDTATAEEITAQSSSSPNQETVPASAWPYLGLIGVIILGLFGTAKKFTSNQTE